LYITQIKNITLTLKKFVDIWRTVDLQSIAASIQNLFLAATDKGLGSLWIKDIFVDREGINRFLDNENNELVAAISLGFPDENHGKPDRKKLSDVVKWPRD